MQLFKNRDKYVEKFKKLNSACGIILYIEFSINSNIIQKERQYNYVYTTEK